MNRETIEIIETIAKQRKIDKAVIIGDLEQAMVSAARKHFNSLDTEEFSCNRVFPRPFLRHFHWSWYIIRCPGENTRTQNAIHRWRIQSIIM